MEKTSVTLHSGEQYTIKLKNIPKTATVKYTYKSDNRYVSVSSKGVVKAKNYPGKQSKITVKARIKEHGKKIKNYTFKLTVNIIKSDKTDGNKKTKDKDKAPELDKKTVSLEPGKSYTIKINNVPKKAELKCTYKANNSYVSVSKKGKIKAKNYPGTETKITIKTTIKEKGKKAKTYTFKQKVKITKKKISDNRKITLNKQNLVITNGDSYWLDAFIDGSYSSFDNVEWSSSNPDIVSVSEYGRISGLSKGTSVITAKLSNGESAKCTVTVNAAKPSSINIDGTKAYLMVGESITITASRFPEYSEGDIQWSVSDPQRVSLISSGDEATITAVEKGSVTITATCGDHSDSESLYITDRVYGINDVWEVDGQWRFKFTGIRNHYNDCLFSHLTRDAAQVVIVDYNYDYIGTKSTSFVDLSKIGTFYDSKGCIAKAFLCFDNDTVSVKNGWFSLNNTVALKNAGYNLTFVASMYNRETQRYENAIFDLGKRNTVKLDYSDMLLYINETGKFKAKTSDIVLWNSENENIAKVDMLSGVITPVGAGTTRIIATTSESQAAGIVTVDPRRSIEFDKTQLELNMNETGKFIATTDLTDPITWASSDTSVATVDPSTGKITPVGPGMASISATQSGRIAAGTVRINPLKITPVSSMGSSIKKIDIKIENTSNKTVFGLNRFGVGIVNGSSREGLLFINGDMLYNDSSIAPGESVTYTFKLPSGMSGYDVPFTFDSDTNYSFTFYYSGKQCLETRFDGALTSLIVE